MSKQWIGALRLKVSLLAGLLTVAGYRLSHINVSWLAVASVFCITVLTMVQNDWRDRFHDIRKGKLLASIRPRSFLSLLCFLWIVVITLIAISALENAYAAMLLTGMAIVALAYSETRRIRFLPVALVCVTSASPVLLPLTAGAPVAPSILLFTMVALVSLGRETFADLKDRSIDAGYKATIAVRSSVKRPDVLACIAIAVGTLLAQRLMPWILLPGVLLSDVGICALAVNVHSKWSWRLLDAGLALILVPIIIRG